MALVTDKSLNDQVLTHLADLEKVLNDMPFTKVGSDFRDEVLITTNGLLLLSKSSRPIIASDKPLRKQWVGDTPPDSTLTLQGRSKWVKEDKQLKSGSSCSSWTTSLTATDWRWAFWTADHLAFREH